MSIIMNAANAVNPTIKPELLCRVTFVCSFFLPERLLALVASNASSLRRVRTLASGHVLDYAIPHLRRPTDHRCQSLACGTADARTRAISARYRAPDGWRASQRR